MRIITDNLDEFRILREDSETIENLNRVCRKSLADFTDDDEEPSVEVVYDLTVGDLSSEDFDYEINDTATHKAIGEGLAEACAEVRDNLMSTCEVETDGGVVYGELVGVRVTLDGFWYVLNELREECVVDKVPQFVGTGNYMYVPVAAKLNYYDL